MMVHAKLSVCALMFSNWKHSPGIVVMEENKPRDDSDASEERFKTELVGLMEIYWRLPIKKWMSATLFSDHSFNSNQVSLLDFSK